MYLKDDAEDEDYSTFLDEYTIRRIVKKYSDYMRYSLNMDVENNRLKEGSDKEYETYVEEVTLNSMIPLWKKDKKSITEEEYNNFYTSKFMDSEDPLKVIHNNVEGLVEYKSMLFIPSHAPYDYYYKEYKKGLELYTNGVLIMDKCEELLPDYYSFVKGVVDSSDLTLNISRETLQNDRRVQTIAKSLETKIHNELLDMLKNDFDKYKKFFEAFGNNIKYGVYDMYGANKDNLLHKKSYENIKNDKKVVAIAKSLETKIHNELLNMMKEEPDKYKKFFDTFGTQIKYGVYDMYGMNKDKIKDLLMFYSGNKKELITLDEYVANMPKSQKEIYYACGKK